MVGNTDAISPSLSFDEEDHIAELVPEEWITRFKAKEMDKRSFDMIIEPKPETDIGIDHIGIDHFNIFIMALTEYQALKRKRLVLLFISSTPPSPSSSVKNFYTNTLEFSTHSDSEIESGLSHDSEIESETNTSSSLPLVSSIHQTDPSQSV
ncbi:unnamed protein product [Cochlearia groenlandica]